MIIQCPSCSTKFSVDSAQLADVEHPRFHCSRCDHFFEFSTAESGEPAAAAHATPQGAAALSPAESTAEDALSAMEEKDLRPVEQLNLLGESAGFAGSLGDLAAFPNDSQFSFADFEDSLLNETASELPATRFQAAKDEPQELSVKDRHVGRALAFDIDDHPVVKADWPDGTSSAEDLFEADLSTVHARMIMAAEVEREDKVFPAPEVQAPTPLISSARVEPSPFEPSLFEPGSFSGSDSDRFLTPADDPSVFGSIFGASKQPDSMSGVQAVGPAPVVARIVEDTEDFSPEDFSMRGSWSSSGTVAGESAGSNPSATRPSSEVPGSYNSKVAAEEKNRAERLGAGTPSVSSATSKAFTDTLRGSSAEQVLAAVTLNRQNAFEGEKPKGGPPEKKKRYLQRRSPGGMREYSALAMATAVPVMCMLGVWGWSANLASTPVALKEFLHLDPIGLPQLPPAGLELVDLQSGFITLDDGKRVLEVRGSVLNATSRTYGRTQLETRVFDPANKQLGHLVVDSRSALTNARVETLTIESLTELQKDVTKGISRLKPNEKVAFRVIFPELGDNSVAPSVRWFSARVYSTVPLES